MPLAEESVRVTILLAVLLDTSLERLPGPVFQKYLQTALGQGVETEEDLWVWLSEQKDLRGLSRASLGHAHRKAAAFVQEGLWAASVQAGDLPSEAAAGCPPVIFGRGSPVQVGPAVSWFNSRKSRSFSPDALWLRALRLTLEKMRSRGATFVGSTGTLTYDLVSAFATATSSPLLEIVPDPLRSKPHPAQPARAMKPHAPVTALSCQLSRRRCPKAVRWHCRDRLAAHLADIHIVLELRPSSRLIPMLVDQHRKSRRAIWVLDGTDAGGARHSGNAELVERFPGQPRRFRADGTSMVDAHPKAPSGMSALPTGRDYAPRWEAYLYHYTRACHGPWPGQDFSHYCISILEGDPLASHSALATLARILRERRVRASHLRVRGKEAVVSLTSRPPRELDLFRRWNRSQARWTLEPYGIAFKKTILRRMGARPAIYGDASVYGALKAEERYRFQIRGTRTSWVNEREWRLKGDLCLEGLAPEDYFIFVPDNTEAGKLATLTELPGPCVTLQTN